MACASCNYFLLHFPFITLIIFLSIVLSNCDSNTNYAACSILYSCGHIQNAGYPFWGDNRPKFCGIPDLKLSCNAKNNHAYPSIHVSQNGLHLQGDVLQINVSSHKMVVHQTDLFEDCPTKESWNNKTSSLTPSLKLDTGYSQSIHLFYGCNSSCVPRYQYTCHNIDDTNGTVYYFGNQSDISRLSKSCLCKNNISFLVDKSVLHELDSTTNASSSLLGVLTKWPYQIEYIANFSACSKCEQSGGRCGSSLDPSSHQFLCYCPGGSQPLMCPLVSGKSSKSARLIITMVASGVVTSTAILALGVCFFKKQAKKYNSFPMELGEDFTTFDSLQYDFASLQSATNNFSNENKLGEGGFGGVYKGILSTGQEIAVKRLSISSSQGVQEFKNEVLLVAKLQHRNLVRLLGFCLAGIEKLLVYEYISNKSLDHFLLNREKQGQLDWKKRYKIIEGVARGMLYLHHDSRLRVIHRDLKASNVLLDVNINPKISDFGMARLFGVDQSQGYTNRVVGTFGYMPPEYVMHGQFSVKTDVYSFGVLVLEIISGMRIRNFQSGYGEDLLSYAWKIWRDGVPLDFMDATIRDSCAINEVMRCMHLGLLCVQESVEERPTIATIVLMLDNHATRLPVPQQPAFSIKSSTDLNFEKHVGFDQLSCKLSTPRSINEVTVTEVEPR